ncbi:MAG: FapA family protein [Lachnospiraceae bacterium]
MSSRSGYVQLKIKNDQTYAIIFPPEEGGKNVELSHVIVYLERHQLKEYNLKELSDVVKEPNEKIEIFVGQSPGYAFNEEVDISVTSDKMLVFADFYPPSEGGKQMSEQDILNELTLNKVVAGINLDVIQEYLKNHDYGQQYLLAKGTPPAHGHDAKIEYFFTTNFNTKPKKNEDGSVNYHDLNIISQVEKDQRLALLHKEDPGKEGQDVLGNIVKPKTVKSLKLDFANNIRLSEDKTEIFSEVTGHVSLVSGKVFVSNIYEVPADVDNSTGDIEYNGSVNIKGNVQSGFVVKARGDIVVEGVVEGAKLYADGQIILKRGIHGMTKGILVAKGNIITKFIENATVESGGFIETESILHSKVSAFSEIRVNGRKGFVTGGLIRAGKLVEAQLIGSEMGTTTLLEVGIDPMKKERYNELKKLIADKKKEIDQIKPILANFSEKMAKGEEIGQNKLMYVQQLAGTYKKMQEQLAPMREELERIHMELSMNDDARVKVFKTIYPGVTVTISDITTGVKDARSFCQFVKDSGEIIIKNM